MTKLKLFALTVTAVLATIVGINASRLSDAASVGTLSVEDLHNRLNASIEQLIEATSAQRAIATDQQALGETATSADEERVTLETQIADLEKNYQNFNGEVKKYNRKCDKAFSETDPELKECFDWQEELQATEDELATTQKTLEQAGAEHDRTQQEIATRRNELAAKATVQSDAIRSFIENAHAVRTEADDRKWFGCIDKDLCDNVKRLDKCMKIESLTCRTGCLQSILEGVSAPICK